MRTDAVRAIDFVRRVIASGIVRRSPRDRNNSRHNTTEVLSKGKRDNKLEPVTERVGWLLTEIRSSSRKRDSAYTNLLPFAPEQWRRGGIQRQPIRRTWRLRRILHIRFKVEALVCLPLLVRTTTQSDGPRGFGGKASSTKRPKRNSRHPKSS